MKLPEMQSSVPSQESWPPVLKLATEEVFETMLGSRLEDAPQGACEDGLDITAMVGLVGAMCGVLSIRCNSSAGTKMASKMLGIDAATAALQICDALGEICNMVAGNFKNKITGMGDGCMLSVPTVVTGADYRCHSLGYSSVLRTNFLFEKESLFIALAIQT